MTLGPSFLSDADEIAPDSPLPRAAALARLFAPRRPRRRLRPSRSMRAAASAFSAVAAAIVLCGALAFAVRPDARTIAALVEDAARAHGVAIGVDAVRLAFGEGALTIVADAPRIRTGAAAAARITARLPIPALLGGDAFPETLIVEGLEAALTLADGTPQGDADASSIVTGSIASGPPDFRPLLASLLGSAGPAPSIRLDGARLDLVTGEGGRIALPALDVAPVENEPGAWRVALAEHHGAVDGRLRLGPAGQGAEASFEAEAPLAVLARLWPALEVASPSAVGRVALSARILLSAEGAPIAARASIRLLDARMADRPAEAALDLVWPGSGGPIAVERLMVASGGHAFHGAGAIALTPQPSLRIDRGRFEAAAAGSAPVVVDGVSFVLERDGTGAALRDLAIADDGVALAGAARLAGLVAADRAAPAPSIEADLAIARADVRTILALWPSAVAPGGRRFVEERMPAGTISAARMAVRLPPRDVLRALADEALPAEAFLLEGRFDGAAVTFDPGRPKLAGLAGSGRIDAAGMALRIEDGRIESAGRSLAITGGELEATFAKGRGRIAASPRLRGPLADALALLAAIEPAAREALDARLAGADGMVYATVDIAMPLSERIARRDIVVGARARLRGVRIPGAIDGEAIERGAFDLTLARGRLEVAGEARWRGLPVRLAVSGDERRILRQNMTLDLDEASRTRLGLPRGIVSGSLRVIASPAGDGAVDLRIDARRAAVALPALGWRKARGRPAEAAMRMKRSAAGVALTDIAFDAPGLAFRGEATFAADGALRTATIAGLRLGGRPAISVEAKRDGRRLVVRLAANSFDARGLLDGVSGEGPALASPFGVDETTIDATVTALEGHNGEIIAGARLSARLDRRGLAEASFAGALNGREATLRAARREGALAIDIAAGDAGGMLRFVDLYRRVEGGRLRARLDGREGASHGRLTLWDFAILDEPALARLGQAGAGGGERARRTPFTKARIRFTREGGRIAIREGVIWGEAIGGTLQGVFDRTRDRVALEGVFVPAYGVNNLFARIPLIGEILGGDQYEGLFAVPFTITGKASAPNLTVNALSAVAPGILRKIFDLKSAPAE